MLLQPLSILALTLAVLATLSSPAAAAPASIYVRHESVRVTDPVATSFFDANHSAAASLATGSFRPLATTPAAQTLSSTGAGIDSNLVITNNNTFPFTIWKGTLGAHFAGTYSVVPPGPSLDTGADSSVFLAVVTTGATPTNYSVKLDHVLRTNGIQAEDVNTVTPVTTGGATYVVTAATFTSFVGDLTMPTITLLAGQSMIIALQIDAYAQRNATADFFNTGGTQLRFDLPAGVVLATNSTVPLAWITVPEPGRLETLVAGVVALTTMAMAKRRRACRP